MSEIDIENGTLEGLLKKRDSMVMSQQIPGLGNVSRADFVRRIRCGGRRRGSWQLPGLGSSAGASGPAARARLARHQQLHSTRSAARPGIRQLRYVCYTSAFHYRFWFSIPLATFRKSHFKSEEDRRGDSLKRDESSEFIRIDVPTR